jgi:hypothetical protein
MKFIISYIEDNEIGASAVILCHPETRWQRHLLAEQASIPASPRKVARRISYANKQYALIWRLVYLTLIFLFS